MTLEERIVELEAEIARKRKELEALPPIDDAYVYRLMRDALARALPPPPKQGKRTRRTRSKVVG